MKIAFIKTNAESSGYVVNGLGLLSAIGKQYGHESVWANAALFVVDPLTPSGLPMDVDVVALTCCSDAFPLARRVAQSYRAYAPGVKIWVGGPHPTYVPSDFDLPEFDHVVIGEGEDVWRQFCQGVEPAEKFIHGTSPKNLDDLPFVDRQQENDFLNGSENPPAPLHQFPGPYKCILAGRGCRFNCAFCKPGTFTMFGKRSRRRTVQSVMGEIMFSMGEFGSIFIHDDNLIEDEAWCSAFVSRWCGKPFLIQGRADLIVKQEKLLKRMRHHGLSAMLIGFESGSNDTLKRMRKGTTVAINKHAAEICHELGIIIQANMIFGTPGETMGDVDATLRFIKDVLQPCIVSPAIYTPYPGSDWGKLCNDNGWNLVKNTYNYQRGIGVGGRKLDEAAFGYTYDWLYDRLQKAGTM